MPGKSEGGRTAPRAPRAAAGADNCCSREAREGCMYKPRGGRLSSKLDAAAKKAQLRTWVQWRKQTACLAPPYKMILMVEYDVKVMLALMEQAAEAVDAIFSSISAYDVRQQAGRTYDNAGEVLPSGVALLLATVGPLDEEDVFLDWSWQHPRPCRSYNGRSTLRWYRISTRPCLARSALFAPAAQDSAATG
ncbi:hypothetical protein F444_00699 [Phytophthora nicotianae P1976]|uniref:Uncharacterized protein n=1 Tax=Phytophthora nicotianae P1976 TaxID=1317066 RepID=A0A081B3F3_PHYNI|nr:hypothetical protein F444_00699 [Phytophthora nicotianae P1976]